MSRSAAGPIERNLVRTSVAGSGGGRRACQRHGGARSSAALLVCAAVFAACAPRAAPAQCATSGTNQTCTNTAGTTVSGGAIGIFDNATLTVTNFGTITGVNFGIDATTANVSNSGTITGVGIGSDGINAATTATVSNSGTITGGSDGIFANTTATVSNSGTIRGGTDGISANTATVGNSGTITGGSDGIEATTAYVSNSGTITGVGGPISVGITATTAYVSNSGTITGGTIGIAATTFATISNSGIITGGLAGIDAGTPTVSNSGTITGGTYGIDATKANVSNTGTISGGVAGINAANTAYVTNFGTITGGDFGVVAATVHVSNSGTISGGTGIFAIISSTVVNSGTIIGTGGTAINFSASSADTLTNIVGGRVIGAILLGTGDTVNFAGGNWLFTFNTLAGATINTGGAPFVVSGNQVAVLDPTTFALADRALVNFTGGIAEMLQGRFAFMGGGGGASAIGFAPEQSSGVANAAQAAFAGIPSVAVAYASDPPPSVGNMPVRPVVYDTTVWTSGFGGGRQQNADGTVLPATDTAYGGAIGLERALGSNMWLGGFVGAGAGREAVELSVQTIASTYTFGGVYGHLDWTAPYLDLALYGGGMNNSSSRQVANNAAPTGFETATASYGGWFVSPQVTYGYRIPWSGLVVTPRLSLRYVGGVLDGYSESGSAQNLTVGSRAINDLEERLDVELSEFKPLAAGGSIKIFVNAGVIGLERLGNPTINTVLLGQNLSFVTPGQAAAVGPLLGAGIEYRIRQNVALFVSGEGSLMSDRSGYAAGQGGVHVSF